MTYVVDIGREEGHVYRLVHFRTHSYLGLVTMNGERSEKTCKAKQSPELQSSGLACCGV